MFDYDYRCFLPKELFPEEYSDYPVKTKKLFALLLNEASDSDSLYELAELIRSIEKNNLDSMLECLKQIKSLWAQKY